MDQDDNFQNQNNNNTGGRDRRHKYLKNRDKYAGQYETFSIKDSSTIQDGMVMERESTDGKYGYCFGVFWLIWLGIVIYAFVASGFNFVSQGDEVEEEKALKSHMYKEKSMIELLANHLSNLYDFDNGYHMSSEER